MTNQIGKRYVCAHCSTQLLVVKPGSGQLECHGEPMTIEVPKPLPASD
jgi:desulfoferrodoxin-like iron-binding protein